MIKNKTLKALPILLGSMFCLNANAGVFATSYLQINDLFVQIDTDGDGIPDVSPTDLGNYVTISGGTRESNSIVNFNGDTDGDNAAAPSPIGTADALLACTGPSCAGLGLTNNGQTLDGGNLINDHTQDYSAADAFISGSAIGTGANSFTYADVGISKPNAIANASSAIFNNILTNLTLNILQPNVRIRFVAVYDAFVDALITPDITADNNRKATASAEASFNTTIIGIGGGATAGEVLNHGLSFSDFAFDVPGLGNLSTISANNANYTGDWSSALSAGIYQAQVASDSDVQASLIPEPTSIALLALGLLGLAGRRRNS